jgi:hypothetical protein
MSKTKDLGKKSSDLIDFTAVRISVKAYSLLSIIQMECCGSHCATFRGIGSVVKTVKSILVSVVKVEHLRLETNPVRIKISRSNKLTSLRDLDLKCRRTLH